VLFGTLSFGRFAGVEEGLREGGWRGSSAREGGALVGGGAIAATGEPTEINYLLFIIYYLLFIIHYSLFIIYYSLFIIHYLFFIIYYLFFISFNIIFTFLDLCIMLIF
jgi:hypothetical protein